MIRIEFLKPYYIKRSGNKLRVAFAYQYLSIEKDEEIFHFIPTEGKEIIVNLSTMQVENLSEVFVFQRGNRFIRLPLYQLMLISNIQEHLISIIESSNHVADIFDEENNISATTQSIIFELERGFVEKEIDRALTERNENNFYKLVDILNTLEEKI